MKNDNLIRLSQGQLNLLETCPVQFQRVYLEQLGSPLSPQQQEKLAWGSQFHLLMQQKELGLPIDSLLAENEQLEHSIASLINAAPEIWLSQNDIWRAAEHCRTFNFQDYLLTVIYDLIVCDRTEAKIIDWKTYLQPETRSNLAKNWQTRLYLYVLVETSDYLPEQVSMTYWFVKNYHKPQSLRFSYDRYQHEKTHQDLSILLARLTIWLEDYLFNKTSFPHLSQCQEICSFYQSLGQQRSVFQKQKNFDRHAMTAFEEIEEVVI
jgi:hypothetical protein